MGTNGINDFVERQVQHPLVEENQRVHGEVLRCRSNVLGDGQVREERFDPGLGRQEILAGSHVVKPNEPDNPLQVGVALCE